MNHRSPLGVGILALAAAASLALPACAIRAWAASPADRLAPGEVRAVPTFECLGLSWNAPGGAADRVCRVRYRKAGDEAWREALPLWYDARDKVYDARDQVWHKIRGPEYRGSIVNLQPGTVYEVSLALEGTAAAATLRAATWPEAFPIARTVTLARHSREPLVIEESGTAGGYILYTRPADSETATIDVEGRHDACVRVNAAHVILRGLTLKNAAVHGVQLAGPARDVVIEECDISAWGRIRPDGWAQDMDSAVYSREPSLERIVVQRNRIHSPRGTSNNWLQQRQRRDGTKSGHPSGPQAVTFVNSAGNHVIRYNTVCGGEKNHYYNDIFGAGSNFSTAGFPNCDSDIYGNLLSQCWDNPVESEGANGNVRIWGNFITDSYAAIATATTSVGPLYVWRNVTHVIRQAPESPAGAFLKTSDRMGGGRIYVFHNTILQPPASSGKQETAGAHTGLGHGGGMVNVVSRNNILHVQAGGSSIYDRTRDPQSRYDYDLYSGRATAAQPCETHGIQGVPAYRTSPVLNDGRGRFDLAPDSPGHDAGLPIPNFNDGFTGKAPDMGAHESATRPMEFGAAAYRSPNRPTAPARQ